MSGVGNIYDLGYQGYSGPRRGRPAVVASFLRSTLAAAYGIGRGGRAKIAPFAFLILAIVPAIIAVGITALAAQAGAAEFLDEASPIRHATYQGLTSTLIMLFCAAQAPELFGRDQRYGVLPLYFSRVLTRVDYALGRLGGLFLAVFVICVTPQILLTIGAFMAAADPGEAFAEQAVEVPRYLVLCLVASGLLAAVGGVVAAWTPRRAYATAAIIAVFIIPPIVVLLLAELAVGDLASVLVLFSPPDILDGLNAALYDTIADSPAVVAADLPGWAYFAAAMTWIVASVALIIRRYLVVGG